MRIYPSNNNKGTFFKNKKEEKLYKEIYLATLTGALANPEVGILTASEDQQEATINTIESFALTAFLESRPVFESPKPKD